MNIYLLLGLLAPSFVCILYWLHAYRSACSPSTLLIPLIISDCTGPSQWVLSRLMLNLLVATFSTQQAMFAFICAYTCILIYIMVPLVSILVTMTKLDRLSGNVTKQAPFIRILKMYTQIELLTTQYNSIHEGYLSYIVTFVTNFALIAALSSWIKFGGEVTMIILCIRIISTKLFMLLEVDGNMKSGLSRMNRVILRKLKQNQCHKPHRWEGKFLRARRPLRVNFNAHGYSYTDSTALRILDFDVNQTVTIILI